MQDTKVSIVTLTYFGAEKTIEGDITLWGLQKQHGKVVLDI